MNEIHPEETCQKCGNCNVIWSAPPELWNELYPDEGIVCPKCFSETAEKNGYSVMFRVEYKRSNMKTSKTGIKMIAEFEGFKSKPYLDVVGIPTIGHGFTFYPKTKKKVTLKDSPITLEESYNILSEMLVQFENGVKKAVKVPINQNQFDALVSFSYNVGIGAFSNSTLLKKLNKNPNDKSIEKEFLRWNKAGGRVFKGLTNRRIKEAKLYFS